MSFNIFIINSISSSLDFIRFCTTTTQFQLRFHFTTQFQLRFHFTTQFQLRFHFTNSIPFHFTIFNHEADSTTTTTVAAGSGSRNNNNRPCRRLDLTPPLPQHEPQIVVLLPLPLSSAPNSSSKWNICNGQKMRGETRGRHTKLDPKVRARRGVGGVPVRGLFGAAPTPQRLRPLLYVTIILKCDLGHHLPYINLTWKLVIYSVTCVTRIQARTLSAIPDKSKWIPSKRTTRLTDHVSSTAIDKSDSVDLISNVCLLVASYLPLSALNSARTSD
ncbi:hypothetical protein QVD17_09831 [Tagetes erecta]|uniref:Uncharacterized protein n=1 Tax=Tagetes erecta TaxID=13708 RepID=A0AAD8L1N5_TARER|nr:hypothetical protein QVD17_09831 [Tagetes erecta]